MVQADHASNAVPSLASRTWPVYLASRIGNRCVCENPVYHLLAMELARNSVLESVLALISFVMKYSTSDKADSTPASKKAIAVTKQMTKFASSHTQTHASTGKLVARNVVVCVFCGRVRRADSGFEEGDQRQSQLVVFGKRNAFHQVLNDGQTGLTRCQ